MCLHKLVFFLHCAHKSKQPPAATFSVVKFVFLWCVSDGTWNKSYLRFISCDVFIRTFVQCVSCFKSLELTAWVNRFLYFFLDTLCIHLRQCWSAAVGMFSACAAPKKQSSCSRWSHSRGGPGNWWADSADNTAGVRWPHGFHNCSQAQHHHGLHKVKFRGYVKWYSGFVRVLKNLENPWILGVWS